MTTNSFGVTDADIQRIFGALEASGRVPQGTAAAHLGQFQQNPDSYSPPGLNGLAQTVGVTGVTDVGAPSPPVPAPISPASAGFVEGQLRASSDSPGGFQRLTNGQWVNTDSRGVPVGAPRPTISGKLSSARGGLVPGSLVGARPGQVTQGGSAAGAPAGWPANLPFPLRGTRVVTVGGQSFEQDVDDWDATVNLMQGLGIAGFAQAPPRGPSLDEQIADALFRGNLEEAEGLRTFRDGLTAQQRQAVEILPLEQQRLARDRFETEKEARRFQEAMALRQETGRGVERGFERAFQERQFGASEEARRFQQELASAQERASGIESGFDRAFRERQFDQQMAQAAFQRGMTERDFAASEEGRAFRQQLAQSQFGATEQAGQFQRGLAERQFGAGEQARAFQQQQELQRFGIDLLRSPGNQFLYQQLLRGFGPTVPFRPQTGEVVPRTLGAPGMFGPSAGQAGGGFFGGFPALERVAQGQPVGQARQLPSLGAPAFPSLQAFNRLTPSERDVFQTGVQAQGFPLEDYLSQLEQTFPRSFQSGQITNAPQRFGRF